MRKSILVSRRLCLLGALVCLPFAALDLRADSLPQLAPPVVLTGTLTTPSGQPLPQVTLSFFDNPPSSAAELNSSIYTAVTDEKGRFAYTVPPSETVWVTSDTSANFSALNPEVAILNNGLPYDSSQYKPCAGFFLRKGPAPEVKLITPEVGYASITVLAPDGHPVPSRDISVTRSDFNYSWSQRDAIGTMHTDAAGNLTLRAFTPSVMHLQVLAPGVGLGSTGDFSFQPNATVTPLMPPMIPLAQLSGEVAPQLRAPGTTITCREVGTALNWNDPTVPIDSAGRFIIQNAIPGDCQLSVEQGGRQVGGMALTVTPGQNLTSLKIDAYHQLPASTTGNSSSPSPGHPATAALTVQGQVTDESGQPVADTDVYAIYSPYKWEPPMSSLGMWMPNYQKTSTRADSQGRYSFEPLNTTSATIVACHPGFVVAEAEAELPIRKTGGYVSWTSTETADVVLPKSNSSLTVRVTSAGQPSAGALVELKPDDQSRRSSFFYPNPEALLPQLFTPSATTDANGDAIFPDLKPGYWECSAAASGRPTDLRWLTSTFPTAPAPTSAAAAGGIAVLRGQTTDFELALDSAPLPAKIQVLTPAGQAPVNSEPEYSAQLANSESGAENASTDMSGAATLKFGQAGLWRVITQAHEDGVDIDGVSVPPVYTASAYIAFSPALSHDQPRILRPVRQVGATLAMRLIDQDGKPVRGAVIVGNGFSDAFAGSTDDYGTIVFTDFPAGQFQVEASDYSGEGVLSTNWSGGPWADSPALSECREFKTKQVTTELGNITRVTLQDQTLQYAQVDLELPAGESSDGYMLTFDQGYLGNVWASRNPGARYWSAGPMQPGAAVAYLYKQVGSGPSSVRTLVLKVPYLVASNSAKLVLAPTPEQIAASLKSPVIPPKPVALPAMVLLPDGKTPAWPARVAVVYPSDESLSHYDVTGPDGICADLGTPNTDQTTLDGAAHHPMIAAWIPGAYGAVVQSIVPGARQTLILPQPLAVHGTVTVGGKAIAGVLTESSYQVSAAYSGHGSLDAKLSVTLTPQADGGFDLTGLTPGTYSLQAARDGIWLSKQQTIMVKPGAAPSAVTLDIPLPGAPVTLTMLDDRNRPAAGEAVALDIPDGPLTRTLWPAELTTDSFGQLTVEGLTAGRHEARLLVSGDTITFNVPALPTMTSAARPT